MGSPQRRNLPKEEPLTYFGNWCGPGWSAGRQVSSAGQLTATDLSIGGRVVIGSTGVQRQSPIDLACKVHDIAYQDIYNTPNYRLAASKQLTADINLFSAASQLIDQTNRGVGDLNLGEMLYAKNVRMAFGFKIVIETLKLGYGPNIRPSSFLTPFQDQLRSEAIAAGGVVYGSFTDDFGGVTSFSYNSSGEAFFKSTTFDSSVTGYLSTTGNTNLTFATLGADGSILNHLSSASFGGGEFATDGSLLVYDATGINSQTGNAQFLNDAGQLQDLPSSPTEQVPVQPTDPFDVSFAQIAQTFGSTLGRLIGGSNLFIGVAAGSIISAAALSVGQSLFNVNYYPNGNVVGASTTGTGSVWTDFQNNLSQFGVNASIGAVSSYLTAELAQTLGFQGFAGRAFSAVTGNVLQYTATQIAQGQTVGAALKSLDSKAFGSTLESGIAGFIGTELASLIVQPQTVAESTLASLGSAVGSIIASSSGTLFGVIGLPGGPLGVGIAAFVGFILGDLIGSLFGHRKPRIPTASAETILQLPFASYAIGAETSANGGNLVLVDAMAGAARDTLNGIISFVTRGEHAAFVANAFSPTQIYGLAGSQLYVTLGGVRSNVDTADQAVDKGVLWALPQTQIIGGDIILKRMLARGQEPSVTALLGDLQIAKDYETYLSQAPIIDAAIADAFNALSADDKAFFAANKAFITRALSASQVPLSGADQAFYQANQTQVDRIINSTSVSSFAAGWIVTLARAAELGLGNFGASDFFGGLQGFLQSFGVSSAGSVVHYEDITTSLAGGTLTVAAPGAVAAKLFSLLPSSSTDGSSIAIASFGAQVGYVEQAIGNRSAASDIAVAAPGSGAVTVYAGTPGYNYGYYGSYPGTDGGSDIIIGAGGNDYLAAGSGGDWIDGQGGDDQIFGGAGADVLLGGDGNDQISGGTGRQYLAGGAGNDYLDGGGAADVLVGGAGSDTLHGGDGNDILLADEDGGGTFDLLDGGSGVDTVSFERFSSGVTADISAQAASQVATVIDTNYTMFPDQPIFSPNGQYRFVYQSDQNLVLYGPGNAVLWSSNTRHAGGFHVQFSTDGNLVMPSANGISWQSYSGGHSGAVFTLDDAGQINISDQDGTTYWSVGGGGYVPAVNSYVYGDQWTSIENITGSNYNDHLTGTNFGSRLKGLAGDDVLTGGNGDDILDGGAGSDQLIGGGGANTAAYSTSAAGVYVNLATGTAIGGDATGDTFSNIQNLSGSNLSDEFAGNAGANVIKAGGGDDWMDATTGGDIYDGGDGYDTVDYSATTFAAGTTTFEYGGIPYTWTSPAVSVYVSDIGSSATYRDADGSTGYHSFISIEQVIGTASDDSFSSVGSALNLTWNGGAGSDTFAGGDGSDTYVFGHGFGVYSISDTSAASNTLQMTPDVLFDDLWVANAGGTLQVGIRGETGYAAFSANFATAANGVLKTLDMAGAGHVDFTQINAVYGGGDGDDGISAGAGTYNLIFAYNGNDTIYAANGGYSYAGSVIYAGLGNDTIVTSVGDDQFLFERGNGHDYVMDGGGQNTIVFGPTVAADDILYEVVGNDLIIGIKDLNNPNLTASQVADTIHIVGGAVKYVGSTYGTTYWNTGFSIEAGGATTDLTKASIAWVVQSYDDSYQGGGGGYGGGYGGNGGYIPPIVLDLGNDGLQITPVAQSSIVTQDAAGNVLRTSWVGPTNGILAYDRNGDGRIDNSADISFTRDQAGARTDLEGLAGWDSNADGVLDARDQNFAKLVVWVDANQDGQQEAGEVRSLLAAGVQSINLHGTPTGFDGSDTVDTVVRNTTTFTRSDGSSGTAYDVALARRALGDEDITSILGARGLGGAAEFGRLLNDPLIAARARGASGAGLTANALGALAEVARGGLVNTSLSAADAERWATALDPTAKAALADLLSGGMSGADLLDAIRANPAYANDGTSLFGRGVRTAATRMQAVVIDYNRNGADLIDAQQAHALVDVARTGMPAQIGWVKGADGILAYDANGNGQVEASSEVDFTRAVANARTALQGLGAYDTDRDGALSAADSGFANFLIWRDKNGNGRSEAGEAQTLEQAGVTRLDLARATSRSMTGGNTANEVLGVSKVTFADGSTRSLYDVALGFADGDDETATTPRQTPSAEQPLLRSDRQQSQPVAAIGRASTAGPDLRFGGDAAGVAHGPAALSGPQGVIVNAEQSTAVSIPWWRASSVSGDQMIAIRSSQLASGTIIDGDRATVSGVAGGNAAQLQRLQLLRQNMAALPGDLGGGAAVWHRGGDGDMPLAVPVTVAALAPVVGKAGLAG